MKCQQAPSPLFRLIDYRIMRKIITKQELLFLFLIYLIGIYFRLIPRLLIDTHLLTLNADIWERIAIAQYFIDHSNLPQFSIRYLAYGKVPLWYPPVGPVVFAFLSKFSHLDLATLSSRIIPFLEALTPLSFYFLARYLCNRQIAFLATGILSLTPSFVYWSGISCPQSLTIFMIPIYLLIWISYLRKRDTLAIRSRLLRLVLLGLLLGINFLTHLTYFLALIIMLLITLALVIEERHKLSVCLELFFVFIISQIVTAWWWLPRNLYWWWTKALVTSSGLAPHLKQLTDYGLAAGILGIAATIFLIVYRFRVKVEKKKSLILILLFWMLFPLLETQNEVILNLINRVDLTWSTLFKPLEGFRFYCFVAQPASLIIAISVFEIILKRRKRSFVNGLKSLCIFLLFLGLAYDIHFNYEFYARMQNAGITRQEYDAAVWFKKHSQSGDRIIADYYRAQMFAGVCGGRALLGGVFPLRNVDFPYIKAPGVVQNDIYRIYSTEDVHEALELIERYKCTHIFYSDNMIHNGGFGSRYKKGFGVDIAKEKFMNNRYFQQVYNKDDIVIIKRRQ